MAASNSIDLDWSVTPEKVDKALRRIIESANPLQIILFGSRARGDHRPDSDIDLAVILDVPEDEVEERLSYSILRRIRMEVTLVPVSKEKYDQHRPWLNSVFHYIDTEGVVLYDREHPQLAGKTAFGSRPARTSRRSSLRCPTRFTGSMPSKALCQVVQGAHHFPQRSV